MSWHTWPVYGFGLIITDEREIEEFLKCNDAEETMYDFVNERNGTLMTSDECDSMSMSSIEDDSAYEENPYYAICFWTKRAPSVVNAPYESYEEIVEEFRSREDIRFPDDFDLRKHLGYFSCTMSG